ncbi:SUR7 family protein Fmp45p [[Candida] anglica]|uniref:SUR7 family protein Fmp45p n=1 Tax=[Candida] anglica TaxID=148631 RepID=A0ABP0EAU4_9ASCO
MSQSRRFLVLAPVILLVASFCLLLVVNLNGFTSALRRLYWSQADTSNIRGAPFAVTRWTSYGLCGVDFSGRNNGCTRRQFAFPYSPSYNFANADNLPEDFVRNRNRYRSLSRAAYGLFLAGVIATAVSVLSLISAVFRQSMALVTTGFVSNLIALLVTIVAAVLISFAHFSGVNTFRTEFGVASDIGTKLFGVTYAAVAGLLLAFIFQLVIMCIYPRKKYVVGPAPVPGPSRNYDPNLYNDQSNNTTWNKSYMNGQQPFQSMKDVKHGPNNWSGNH